MAAVQDLEIQFAQKLASNEKSIRTKALKRLKKYIHVRSQKTTDGFTSDELLKLWKGLFYCLWMQDKPLLQEDLSDSISTLIHSFHDINGQLLYLESCLKTFKREWNGIDRLRMDKFYQLIRFMFRKSFEMLKKKNWESSVVARFLELFATELLNSGNVAPAGLQFHIFDLYLTELAAVGSSELTADQNLIFIEPFCKTAAKTKDRILFRAICSSIFSTIIDQAPDAIIDLMKELNVAECPDLGQSSEGDEKNLVMQIDGSKSNLEQDDHKVRSGDLNSESPFDTITPVLQFNYAALADKLFDMASRTTTPSSNRRRLYKIIKVLRDISEGIFPQDGFSEQVSTDQDDEMFGIRKRMNDEPLTEQATMNRKKKMKFKQERDSGQDVKPTDVIVKDIKKPKKTKKRECHGGSLIDLNVGTFNVEDTDIPNQRSILQNGSADNPEPYVSRSERACKLSSSIPSNDKSEKKTKRPRSKLEQEKRIGNAGTPQEVDTTPVVTVDNEGTSKATNFEAQVHKMESPEPEFQLLNNTKTKAKKVKDFVTGSQQKLFDSPSVSFRTNERESGSDLHTGTPLKKKNKQISVQVKNVSSTEEEPLVFSSPEKPKKKKRKIPVEFDFEAVEHESATPTNNSTPRAASVKKVKEIYGSSTPKAKPKLMKLLSCDFTFQTNAKVPTPLYFRAEGRWVKLPHQIPRR
ncbi:ribosomal RNA processing protein 1 homolog A-like isoform X3 [Syngnathoides biaculeatus]|uniref:ribosomal RNA processing protein 1 homolog A-like isoform X3 n=1 Tax=Syngnathoides biaculeatus TaxID=300417 RepID=UPI002ADD814F|nr:ribosomal RNA processing protein 1 homolog A-like isoform X3 [Syngnathoides biaculeatus]